jgi:hypothetical protein
MEHHYDYFKRFSLYNHHLFCSASKIETPMAPAVTTIATEWFERARSKSCGKPSCYRFPISDIEELIGASQQGKNNDVNVG